MAEKIAKLGVIREAGWLYYLRGGQIRRVRARSRTDPPGKTEKPQDELVASSNFEREEGYLYFLDRSGDVSRARRATGSTSADDDDDDDDDDDVSDEETRALAAEKDRESAKELIYTLFSDLDVPQSSVDIRLIADRSTLIFRQVLEAGHMEQLTPRELEELLAECFRREGYETLLTPATRDGGRDVIAVLPGSLPFLVVAEAKKTRLVAPALVHSLVAVRERDNANMALIATTGRFSDDTRQEVSRKWTRLLRLKDGEEMIRWIQQLGSKR